MHTSVKFMNKIVNMLPTAQHDKSKVFYSVVAWLSITVLQLFSYKHENRWIFSLQNHKIHLQYNPSISRYARCHVEALEKPQQP